MTRKGLGPALIGLVICLGGLVGSNVDLPDVVFLLAALAMIGGGIAVLVALLIAGIGLMKSLAPRSE